MTLSVCTDSSRPPRLSLSGKLLVGGAETLMDAFVWEAIAEKGPHLFSAGVVSALFLLLVTLPGPSLVAPLCCSLSVDPPALRGSNIRAPIEGLQSSTVHVVSRKVARERKIEISVSGL